MKNKFVIIALAFAGIALAGGGLFYYSTLRAALDALEAEKRESAPASYSAKIQDLGPLDKTRREGWKIIATGREIRDMAWFEDRLWAATSGGLLSISQDGQSVALYTRLNGLPDANVTCLAESEGKLFAGAGSGALVIIKGGRLAIVSFPDKSPSRITALLPTPGGVIFGTGEAGVWLFNGRAISDVAEGRAGADFKKVTALHRFGGNLVIGTFDSGVYVEGPGGFSHYTAEQGLPMNQVTSLGDDGASLLIGTPTGWANLGADGAARRHEGAFVTSFTNDDGGLLIGTGAGIVNAGAEGKSSRALEGARITSLRIIGGNVFAGTDNGIYRRAGDAWAPFYQPGDREIAGNHVTAITPAGGNLWVGTFEDGLDILDESGAVKSRPADESAWAINGILADGDSVYVAHNAGVSVYRGDALVKHITDKDGLIGQRVSAVCSMLGGRAYATEAGVTIESGGLMNSLYVFHGLANNHAYACASVGSGIYIGTLGGLNLIENLKVKKTWRPGEGKLKLGWITALAASGGNLFIGTYGGGVMKLDAPGQWSDYSASIGAFEVNPGAMLISDDRLFVGSLDRGLFVINIANEKWRNLTDALASQNVTAIARFNDLFYIGTERGITVIPRRDIE